MKIFKYPLEWRDTQILRLPAMMEPLSLQAQNGVPTLWAIVNDTAELNARHVCMLPTGAAFTGREGHYLGTLQADFLVYHFFMED